MAMDITPLVEPSRTALLTMELQRNLVGDLTSGPLVDEAQKIFPVVQRLLVAARQVGVTVGHCLWHDRRDAVGRNTNVALYKLRKMIPPSPLPPDARLQEGTELVSDLESDPRDLVFNRMHGMSPIYDGGVDPVLRTLGITNVIVVGVSTNIGIPNTVMDLVNRSYEVVVPSDAVAGTPAEYSEAMIQHTIRMLATVTNTEAILNKWNPKT